MTQRFRLQQFGRVNRERPIDFEFEGRAIRGFAGDTLASALLANGVHEVATSIKLGRPRGIVAAGPEDPNALLQLTRPFPDPMQLATTVELAPGIAAHGIPGQGKLPEQPDPARYDAVHLHVDVLVVGAGPAGVAAALSAARDGIRVALVDDQAVPGGTLLGRPSRIDGIDGAEWARRSVETLLSQGVTYLPRTTVFGLYDDGLALAIEKRTDHLGSNAPSDALRQRVWRIRARHTLLATGSHERPVVFANNDRPGIMLAAAARTYLHRYGVAVGENVVTFTTNDSAYSSAFELHDAGVRVAAIVDARREIDDALREGARRRGIPLHDRSVVADTDGAPFDDGGRVVAVTYRTFTDGVLGDDETIPADTLLVSGGWNPAVHLYSQAGGRLRYDDRLGAFVPDDSFDTIAVAGAAAGQFGIAEALSGGAKMGRGAASSLGRETEEAELPSLDEDTDHQPGAVLWYIPSGSPTELNEHFVDAQRDATVADIATAIGAGLRSVEHIKRYTTIGTAHDQGKTSGVITSGITAELTGAPIEDVGTMRLRPPYTPVAFAALAGRNLGHLWDPVRVTPVHDWHVQRGAVFEDVGQWKRPWFYPRSGEDMQDAVAREQVAVRTGVGILDGSTLGKIDVQGPDAPEFLDMLYTNLMSTLKVGSVRYGVLCGVDGMVKDDGTVLRIAEDRYLVYTTTGGAAEVLEWMEEWLQTEWPHLDVYLTSVTDHFVTFPVVGPRSRAVIGSLFPDVDVSQDAFPFMTWRDTELDGIPIRIARVSFSGELAYEVSTIGHYGLALWERIIAAGEAYDITPYGTETMHVLRAEKGYPIIGQDTDGTVTPQDLGMSWIVSKKKEDFIGKRSFTRTANHDPNRRQFVGLLPEDPESFIPEGSQLVSVTSLDIPRPIPMEGFVSSAYVSEALESAFALALVNGGHSRIGEKIHAVVDGRLVPATITSHVLFDQEGARRDG